MLFLFLAGNYLLAHPIKTFQWQIYLENKQNINNQNKNKNIEIFVFLIDPQIVYGAMQKLLLLLVPCCQPKGPID